MHLQEYHLLDSLYTLSKAKRDFLLSAGSGLQIRDGYSRVIKSRLQKKLERFASEELPLLIDKGLYNQRHLRRLMLQDSVTLQKTVTQKKRKPLKMA